MDNARHLHPQPSETSAHWEEVAHAVVEAVCLLAPDHTITYANPRWRELLGVESHELVGSPLGWLVHPGDAESYADAISRALGGARVSGRVWRLRHRDGTWPDALASTAPLRDDAGQVRGALCILHDVSAEHETRRLKEQLLATTSHELRTPVTTIKALTQMLLRRLETGTIDPEQLGRHLRTIQRETERLEALSTGLADTARLPAEHLRLQTEPHDLAAVVAACLERQRARLGPAPRHTLSLTIPLAGVIVMADRDRLSQALANLLDNAVKFSPAGGEVCITVEPDPPLARVRISDRGIGIPAHDLSDLCTPFHHASNTPSHGYGGLGLGLHLSQAIVDAHGGELQVESVEGQGTTVTVSLPLASSVSP